MRGEVRNRRAQLNITLVAPLNTHVDIECVVDTGFTDYLTLPASEIARLGLPFSHDIRARLADGTTAVMRVFDAVIRWHGNEMPISVFETGAKSLVGTALLHKNELRIQFIEGGLVTVDPI